MWAPRGRVGREAPESNLTNNERSRQSFDQFFLSEILTTSSALYFCIALSAKFFAKTLYTRARFPYDTRAYCVHSTAALRGIIPLNSSFR